MVIADHRLGYMIKSYRALATWVLLVTVLAVLILTAPATAGDSDNLQLPSRVPLINASSPKRIPGEYIVVFKEGNNTRTFESIRVDIVVEKVKRLGGTIMQTYMMAPIGLSAKLSEDAVQALRADPSVDYIEVNQTGWYNTVQDLNNPPPPPPTNPPYPNWLPNTWPKGLDRTSERLLPFDKKYTYSESGHNVHVYVIDSGIDHTHTEFGRRVAPGKKIESTTPSTAPPDNDLTVTDDCNGHGTHVAGIIGGANVGIAKQATLHPVRVNAGCGDSTLDRVIKAVQWVQAKAIRPAVVNLSVSFWTDPLADRNALKDAVIASINSNLPHVIAAGNHNTDACTSPPSTSYRESPAIVNYGAPNRAIVVGAVNPNNDTRWNQAPLVGSNTGQCLSLFAPGGDILSARSNQVPSGGTTEQRSGTSQAAAHVTGIVARILGIDGNGNLTPAQVWGKIHSANNVKDDLITGTTVVNGVKWLGVQDPKAGSPNELLHYGSYNDGREDYPPAPPAPVNLIVQ
ncbi:MAG: S8 family peptidase [Nitrospira sp.]